MNIWVGIEITRQMRLEGGALAPVGGLTVGGVNLLAHQIGIAKQLAPSEQVCVLTPQADEPMLELIAQHEIRELAPFDFIAMLAERAAAGEQAGVVLLRQIVPIRAAAVVQPAIDMLAAHPVVLSAVGDEPCMAFEVRRGDQFSGGLSFGIEHMQQISPDDFAEYIKATDEPAVAAKLAAWQVQSRTS